MLIILTLLPSAQTNGLRMASLDRDGLTKILSLLKALIKPETTTLNGKNFAEDTILLKKNAEKMETEFSQNQDQALKKFMPHLVNQAQKD